MVEHTEKIGHCAACKTMIDELSERLDRLELLYLGLDETMARHIRETEAVPAATPAEVTVPERRRA